MIYQVNKDDPYKGYEKGKEIGKKALIYARNLQAPKGMPIFFCCDCAHRFESFDKVAQFLIGVKLRLFADDGFVIDKADCLGNPLGNLMRF